MDELNTTSLLGIPRRCGECGYELRGLDHSGNCPECGGAYDSETIVVFGWAQHGSLATMPPVKARWIFAIGLIAVATLIISAWREEWWMGASLFVSVGVVTAMQLWWRFEKSKDLPGPLQAKLSREGFGYRTGSGSIRLTPWSAADTIFVDSRSRNMRRIQVVRDWLGHMVLLDVVFESNTPPGMIAGHIERLRRVGQSDPVSLHAAPPQD